MPPGLIPYVTPAPRKKRPNAPYAHASHLSREDRVLPAPLVRTQRRRQLPCLLPTAVLPAFSLSSSLLPSSSLPSSSLPPPCCPPPWILLVGLIPAARGLPSPRRSPSCRRTSHVHRQDRLPRRCIVLVCVGLAEMSKMVWDPYYTRVFCDICMEEVNDNNRDWGCLSRKGYKNLGDKFAEKTEERLTQKQFKNKWDALKKDYTGWMELQNATELDWDPITKTMDADDDWWKNHIVIQ